MHYFNYKKIKENDDPYIIAEIGVNHEGSLKNAKKIASKNSPYYWNLKKEPTKSQFELFSKYDNFNERDYRKLANFCKKIKIDFLSTPFDLDSVDLLYPLIPAYKISSSDITNYPLLEKISSKKNQ